MWFPQGHRACRWRRLLHKPCRLQGLPSCPACRPSGGQSNLSLTIGVLSLKCWFSCYSPTQNLPVPSHCLLKEYKWWLIRRIPSSPCPYPRVTHGTALPALVLCPLWVCPSEIPIKLHLQAMVSAKLFSTPQVEFCIHPNPHFTYSTHMAFTFRLLLLCCLSESQASQGQGVWVLFFHAQEF